ncbi:MAG TPA: tyrosine-type recombinase/integrase, partial [Aggregatilineaceae bacterium]|nr:tyrosine-type recombinase/integrase [Aggregatilineaceae bacterium]
NEHAARGAFADYLSRKAENTIRRQSADLARFAEYMQAGSLLPSGRDKPESRLIAVQQAERLQHESEAWHEITWGLVEGFRNWMIQEGDAIGSVNVRLSTIKKYAALAVKAGALQSSEYAMIKLVQGYSHQESKRVDDRREKTRNGFKKAESVHIERLEAKSLKTHPDTPQGRRDALLMCLLLDHGLRVGEVAGLHVSDFDLKAGELKFYRPKVDKLQTHRLTPDTLKAARAYFNAGDVPLAADLPVLRASRKGGKLTAAGMSERAITGRVKELGEKVGLVGLSAHDCRHYWATTAARNKTDPFALQEAGGWNSLAMPRRYVADARIANEGVKLD